MNIYAILLLDILHVLYKRIEKNFVSWLIKLIKKKHKPIQMTKKDISEN